MDKEKFDLLVERAVQSLPKEFLTRLENITVIVEEQPSPDQMRSAGVRRGHILLGLYEGVPQTQRSSFYGLVLPDKITIFQKPIEDGCSNDTEVEAEIRNVVLHEIAHHFGISDERLDELGR